jgi:hypothetical protein
VVNLLKKYKGVAQCGRAVWHSDIALKFQSHLFLCRIPKRSTRTPCLSSIASITRCVVNLFINPTLNYDEYDDMVDEEVDKEKEVTRDYFIELGFTDTPTKHSLRARRDR